MCDPWLTPEVARDGFLLAEAGQARDAIHMSATTRLQGPFLALPTGQHTATVPVTLAVVEQAAGNAKTPVVTFTEALTDDFELLPAGTSTLRAIDDPSAADAVRAAVTGLEVAYGLPQSYVLPGDDPATQLSLRRGVGKLPTNLCHTFFVTDAAGRKYRFANFIEGRAGTDGGGESISFADAPEFAGDAVDVTLRLDRGRAEDSTRLDGEVWGGEVVWKDVPVRRVPATRPTP